MIQNQKKYKEHENLFKNWPINNYSTRYHGPRSNIKHIYVVEYNLEKVFREGARTFSEFKDPTGTEGRSCEEFYQFFWACVQKTWAKIKSGNKKENQSGKRKKADGDEEGEKTKKKKKKNRKSRKGYEDDEAEEGEEEEEEGEGEGGGGGVGDEDEEGRRRMRRSIRNEGASRFPLEEDDSLASSSSWRPPPPAGAARGISFLREESDGSNVEMEAYIEAIRADREKCKQNMTGICDGICGYRVWILLRSDATMEESQLRIIAENTERSILNGKAGALGTYEKYKKIINNSDLAVLTSMYTNNSSFCEQVNLVNDPAFSILNGENLISAKSMYSMVTALMHCDQRAVDSQGPFGWNSYLNSNKESACKTLTFPHPEYVMRLYLDQCTVETMSSKYFPHIQKMGFHPLVSKYPGFFPSLVMAPSNRNTVWKSNRKNQLDKLADEVRQMCVSADDELGGKRNRGEEEEGEREEDVEAEWAKWKSALADLAEKTNFPHFEKIIDMNPFDRNDLTIRQRLRDLHDVVGSPSMTACYRNELACLADEGARVRSDIIRIYAEALKEIDRMAGDPETARAMNRQHQGLPERFRNMGPEHHLNRKTALQRAALHRARVMLLCHQNYLFDQYGKRCRSPDSDISEVGKIMHAFREENGLYTSPNVVHYKVDRRLTSFANFMIRMLTQYEHVQLISDKHLYAQYADLSGYDAYRYSFDLHMNVFTYSVEGGQGKSFLWDLVQKGKIPGTVSFITYQTLRAENVDGDQNDMIKVFNEMPATMFIEQGKNDEAVAAQKEKLTSMKSRAFIYDKKKSDELGVRVNRMAVSECIGVTMGSTNVDVDRVSPAMRSRFHWLNCEPKGESRRSIQELMLAEGMSGCGRTELVNKTNREKMLFQMIIYEVEKLIQIGALSSPTMDGCRVLINLVEHELAQEGITLSHGRKCERDLIMAGILAKMDAIERHYFCPGGEYFGKPITLESMKALDRKMVGFVHHAVYALGLSMDQITNPVEDEVIRAIREFHRSDPRFQDTFRMFLPTTPTDPGRTDHSGGGGGGSGSPANVYNHNYKVGWQGSRVPLAFNSPYLPDQNDSEDRKINKETWDKDYNYITFFNQSITKRDNLYEFAVMLAGFMDSGVLGNRLKPSVSAIMTVLRNLKRRTFACKNYRKPPPTEEEVGISPLDGTFSLSLSHSHFYIYFSLLSLPSSPPSPPLFFSSSFAYLLYNRLHDSDSCQKNQGTASSGHGGGRSRQRFCATNCMHRG